MFNEIFSLANGLVTLVLLIIVFIIVILYNEYMTYRIVMKRHSELIDAGIVEKTKYPWFIDDDLLYYMVETEGCTYDNMYKVWVYAISHEHISKVYKSKKKE